MTYSILSLNPSIFDQNSIPDNTSVDNPLRLKYAGSFWQRIIHFNEKRHLDKKIHHEVFNLFKQRYGFQDNIAFKRTWRRIGAKIWTHAAPLTVGTLRSIDNAFKNQLVYHGCGIKSPIIPPHCIIDKHVQKIVHALMHGGHLSKDLLQKKLLKAIFVNKDSHLLEHFRMALQHELDSLASSPPKNAKEEVMWRAFLGNVVALLPFTYPKANDTITIPILENGTCRPIEYNIEILPLPYPGVASPMTALGLMPANDDKKAPPLLSFIGTTYPAGDGHIATLLADFTPNHSVGELVYNNNKTTIEGWLKDKKDVHVFGMSLGGAMAFHAYRHNHDKLARVDVYNPPGLYPNCWKDKIESECQVNIYCQSGDLVSHLGAWPVGNNVALYLILQHQKGVRENIFSSHTRAFTGCESITILKKDPGQINNSLRRRILTKLHHCLGPIFIYLPLKCLYWLYQLAIAISHWAAQFFKKKKS